MTALKYSSPLKCTGIYLSVSPANLTWDHQGLLLAHASPTVIKKLQAKFCPQKYMQSLVLSSNFALSFTHATSVTKGRWSLALQLGITNWHKDVRARRGSNSFPQSQGLALKWAIKAFFCHERKQDMRLWIQTGISGVRRGHFCTAHCRH